MRKGTSYVGRVAARSILGMSALMLAAAGCNSLLEVDAPSRVVASTLNSPRNASLLVTGAIADLECAFGLYILNGGNMGDEIADAQLQGLYWDVDRRTVNENGLYGINTCDDAVLFGLYRPLQVSRFQADDTGKKLDGWTDAEVTNRTALIATAAAYGGYAVLMLAEAMCSAAIDVGPELTRAQLNSEAEQRFTKAITAGTTANRADIVNMARVGRARARLNQNKTADAVADARLVPAAFVQNATYSTATPRRNNPVFNWINRTGSLTIAAGFRGLTYNNVADPRVPVASAARNGADNFTALWIQNKYASLSSPIPLASYDEAQLIIAEVGGGTEAVGIVNALHTRAGLAADFQSTDAATIRAQVLEERRRELFLEGHHIGDVTRLHLTLSPPAGTPYPAKAGGIYGNTTCLPLPFSERQNNPNINGGS